MANTPFLLESKFNVSPLLQQTFHLPRLGSFHSIKLSSDVNYAFNSSYKAIKGSPKLGIKCFIMSPKLKGEKGILGNGGEKDNDLKTVAVGSGIDEVFWKSTKNVLNALQKPIITGVLLCLLLLYDHHHGYIALAASSASSMGQVDILDEDNEPSSKSHSTNIKGLKPSLSAANPAPTSTRGGGSSVGPAMTESIRKEDLQAVGSGYTCCNFFFFMGFVVFSVGFLFLIDYYSTKKTSVVKLQVGLLDTGRSLQRDLNRIFKETNTSSRAGLRYMLQETTVALLRHPDDCISGYSSVDVERNEAQSEIRFNQLSIEERAKFHEETLVNVSNIRKLSASTQRSNNGVRNEYIVITIIVKADGVLKLPPINSSARLREALQKLATIPSWRIEAVDVLLTPQNENNILTEQDLLQDYSLLCPL